MKYEVTYRRTERQLIESPDEKGAVFIAKELIKRVPDGTLLTIFPYPEEDIHALYHHDPSQRTE